VQQTWNCNGIYRYPSFQTLKSVILHF